MKKTSGPVSLGSKVRCHGVNISKKLDASRGGLCRPTPIRVFGRV
jgi:hypothetical protein